MEICLQHTLRSLRQQKNVTQEALAQHLGITSQSVGKWERGEGYPDITMLPILANYFHVTVDELIGMDEIALSQKLDEINQAWQENRAEGKHKENVALMREALKSYPNNALLLIQLSASLERLDGTDSEKRAYLKESIAVQEQILTYCDDSYVRGAALFNISDAYYRYGDYEKALEYANKLPNLYKTRETALVRILKDDDEKNKAARAALEPLAWLISYHLNAIAETENDPGYKEKAERICDILFDKDT